MRQLHPEEHAGGAGPGENTLRQETTVTHKGADSPYNCSPLTSGKV